MKKIVITTAALLLAACGGSSPEAQVDKFYDAIAKGDAPAIRAMMAKPLQMAVSDAMLGARVAQDQARFAKCGGIKAIEKNVESKGDLRVVRLKIAYKGDCKETTSTETLIKEDGGWKFTL